MHSSRVWRPAWCAAHIHRRRRTGALGPPRVPGTLRLSAATIATTSAARQQFSLSELANAFSEIGKATAYSADGAADGCTDASAKATRGGDDADRRSPQSRREPTRNRTAASASPSSNTDDQAREHPLRAIHGAAASIRSAAHPAVATREAPPPLRNGLATFSLSYARHLASLDLSRLVGEVEEQHRRQHYGNMVGCLIEVHFRLCGHAQTAAVEQGHGIARSFGVDGVPSDGDRLMLATLSCLAKLDLSEVAVDAERWVRQLAVIRRHDVFKASQSPAAEHAGGSGGGVVVATGTPTASSSFIASLSDALQRWALARASEMDAAHSVACLHLLAQQKLFFCDPLLTTLADNVACRHARRPLDELLLTSQRTAVAAVAEPRARLDLAVLPLDVCAVLLDVLARYQVSAFTVLRLVDHATWTEAADNAPGERSPAAVSLEASTASTTTRSLSNRRHGAEALAVIVRDHPILNKAFFTVCVEALLQSLAYASRPETAAPVPAAEVVPHVVTWEGHNTTRFAQLPPASFFFLTRALAKLRFFDGSVVAALLPHLKSYLSQHQEQYLGPVLLLGRPENASIDVDVAKVLLQNVNGVLRRRGDAYQRELRTQQPQQRVVPAARQDTDSASLPRVSDTVGPVDDDMDNAVFLSDNAPRHVRDADEVSFRGVEELEASVVQDTVEPVAPVCGHADHLALQYRAHRGRMALSKQIARAQALVSVASERADHDSRRHPQRVSLIALHATPTFLSSVAHLYQLAWDLALAGGGGGGEGGWGARRALWDEMVCLYVQLLDDLYHGLPRQLDVLTRSMPLPVMEGLLQLLLELRETLLGHLQMVDAHEPRTGPAASRTPAPGTTPPAHHTASADSLCAPHSLLVVLTYLWTQQLRKRPLPHPSGREVAVDWCASARQLTQALVAAGLLARRQVRQPASPAHTRGEVRYHSSRAAADSRGDGGVRTAFFAEAEEVLPAMIYMYFIPEEVLATAPRVEELVERAKLAKLIGMQESMSPHAAAAATSTSPVEDPVLREVRNSTVFFAFSRRIEFAEKGRH